MPLLRKKKRESVCLPIIVDATPSLLSAHLDLRKSLRAECAGSGSLQLDLLPKEDQVKRVFGFGGINECNMIIFRMWLQNAMKSGDQIVRKRIGRKKVPSFLLFAG